MYGFDSWHDSVHKNYKTLYTKVVNNQKAVNWEHPDSTSIIMKIRCVSCQMSELHLNSFENDYWYLLVYSINFTWVLYIRDNSRNSCLLTKTPTTMYDPLPLGRVRKTDADSGPCFKTNWPWYANGLLILSYFNLINCLCSKRGSGIIWTINVYMQINQIKFPQFIHSKLRATYLFSKTVNNLLLKKDTDQNRK